MAREFPSSLTNPLKVIVNPEKSAKANLAENLEFFSIDRENVIITTVKKAEEGDGIVARMYDAEGKEATVKLESFFDLGNLQHTNIIEENPKAVDKIEISPYGIETYLFDVK